MWSSLTEFFFIDNFLKESGLLPSNIPHDGEYIGLDVDEAKRQMVEIDQIDKVTYKAKQKAWKKVFRHLIQQFTRYWFY